MEDLSPQKIQLSNSWDNYFKRSMLGFLRGYFLIIAVLCIGNFLLYGLSSFELLLYSVAFLFACLQSFWFKKKFLYSIVFSDNMIEITEINIDSIINLKPLELKDVRIEVKRDYLTFSSLGVLKVYDGKKCIIKQKEVNGWTYKMFEEIKTVYGKRKKMINRVL